ncbi:hypothetical protein ABPG72_013806 [Tetrahymena utriculariae]
MQSKLYSLTTLNIQKQETEVSQGIVFQRQDTQSSPIYYNMISQQFDRQFSLEEGFGPYLQAIIQMDEIVQQFQIQYPTITEILLLINSVTALFVVFKFIGRNYSKKLIKQDFFIFFFEKFYQDEYQKLLKHNYLREQKNQFCFQKEKIKEDVKDENIEKELTNTFVPNFQTKFKDYVEKKQTSKLKYDSYDIFLKLTDQQNKEKQQKEDQKNNSNGSISHAEEKNKVNIKSKFQNITSLERLLKSPQSKNQLKNVRLILQKEQNSISSQQISSNKTIQTSNSQNIIETININHLNKMEEKKLLD